MFGEFYFGYPFFAEAFFVIIVTNPNLQFGGTSNVLQMSNGSVIDQLRMSGGNTITNLSTPIKDDTQVEDLVPQPPSGSMYDGQPGLQ